MDLAYVPKADNDQNSLPIWVPLPPDRGRNRRFFIEVELLDRRAVPVPLGRVRTYQFSGI